MRRVAGSRSARPDLLPPVVREGGAEGRWGVLLVDVSASEAIRTGMATHELDQELPTALQEYAAARLDNHVAVLDQLRRWDSPVVLFAEHFRR